MRIFEKTYDPLTGLWTTIGAQDGKLVIRTEAEVGKALDRNASLRNSEDYSKTGIKRNWWHAFHIPEILALKMITEDGFDPYAAPAEDTFKFLRRNKDKYGQCLTTRGQF